MSSKALSCEPTRESASVAPRSKSSAPHARLNELSPAAAPTLSNPLAGLQQTVGNQAMLRLLDSGTIQTKLRVSQPGDEDEKEADRVAEQVVSAKHAPKIQRKCACGGTCAECQQEEAGTIHRSASPVLRTSALGIQRAPLPNAPASDVPGKTEDPAKTSPGGAKGHSFVVDDDAEKIEPHQMRKSQFIALLRTDACATADAVLASVGHSTKGCPYIEKWLGFYEKQSAEHIAGAIRKYAPETATARSAHEVIRLVVIRIQRAALTWAKTGKLEGVPKELASQIPGQGGLLEKVHNFASTGVAGAIFGFIGGKKPEDPGSEKVSRKATSAEAAPAHDAASVKSQLGSGHSLDSGVQSQMASAFGHDFSGVRVHTDSGAAKLSSDLQARAFTIGSDVAFGSGEYKPGTLVGDALIAHELAHVVQQSGASAALDPMKKGEGDYDALEQDADRSAIGAMASSIGNISKSWKDSARSIRPRLRSGLGLSRCKPDIADSAKKTVSVNITYLSGGSTALATHLAKANDVYKQANVEVKAGKSMTLDETKSKAILGNDLILDEFNNPNTPTAEEQALFKENRGAGITMYYVKGMSHGSLGEAFYPSTGNPIGFVYASTTSRTWPHELGHVLLDSGDHPADADNFMAQTAVASGKELMTKEQIETIRKNIP